MANYCVDLGAVVVIHWREGDVIRRLRMAAGWGLGKLSTETGLTVNTIHRIEKGQTKEPKRSTLQKLARAFGLTDRQLQDAVPPPMDLPVNFSVITERRTRGVSGPTSPGGRRRRAS